MVPYIREAQRRGAQLVVVDPRTTPLASQADVHLPVRPGTDLPVALELPVEKYSSKATANAGEGYLSVDGELFIDVTSQEGCKNASVCIKGLTVP
jgi:hypothetical protein